MLSSNHLLIRALTLNALFSAFCCIFLFSGGSWLADQYGLTSAVPVYVIAACLAVYAMQLGNIVRTKQIRSWEIISIISGDLAWVAATVAVIVFYYQSITAAGLMLMDIVAVAVLFVAILQIRGLREYRKTAVPG